ncbi:hypothetical protein BDR07DRAFT_1502583 [Suillus spraguei]|nr:hypothetical protein BDR07DRAFT_1502583 [Suillus spraguei]
MYPGQGQRQPSRAPNDLQNQFSPAIRHGTEPEPYSHQFNPGGSSLGLLNHGLPRRDKFFSAGMGGQQDGPVTQTPAPGSFQHHQQDVHLNPGPSHLNSPKMGMIPLYPYRAAATLQAGGTPHLGRTPTPFSGSQTSSRGQSVGPVMQHGGTPMDGYNKPQNYSSQPFYSMHQHQMGHHSSTPHNNLDTPMNYSALNSTVAHLVSEVQNLKDVTQNLLFSNNKF